MKTLFLRTLLLLFLMAAKGYAQSKPAKAPSRTAAKKPAATAPVRTVAPARTPPRTTTTAIQPQAQPASQAAAPTPRSNSTALPQKTTPAPAPQPTPQPQRRQAVAASRPVRSISSGGLGFQKGDKLLNIGIGLSSYYYGNPIGLSYEVGVTEDISVGGQLDYNSGRYNDYYGSSSRYRYSAYYLGARGSYHFNRILRINEKKVDLYAGLGLGYQRFSWNDSYTGRGYGYDYGSGLFLNYFIGGKYYFTDKVGAFAELGYTGLASTRVGLAVKF